MASLLAAVIWLVSTWERAPSPSAALRPPNRVAHAGGGIEGQTYTNSLEALERNFAIGFRFFEIDLKWTRDGQLVCVHDWREWRQAVPDRDLLAAPPSLQEFLEMRLKFSRFLPCTLHELADWMSRRPEAVLITDVFRNNLRALRRIRGRIERAPSRVIPQIYQPEEYEPVRAMGYRRILWTLYRYRRDDGEVLRWARRLDLYGVTMPPPRANVSLLAELRRLGSYTYVHTINDCESLRLFRSHGVDEVYTDFLSQRTCP